MAWLANRKHFWRMGLMGILLLWLGGCGAESLTDRLDAVTEEKEDLSERVVIEGKVYDDVVPFAEVVLVLYPDTTLGVVTADAEGRWHYETLTSRLQVGSFLLLRASNPANGLQIRSLVKTDEIVAAGRTTYTSPQTTISHYSEAALTLMMGEGGLDETRYEKYMKKIVVKEGIPEETGEPAIDAIAAVVQEHFDDEKGSQKRMRLDAYWEMLRHLNPPKALRPDDEGVVGLRLPYDESGEIEVTVDVPEGVRTEHSEWEIALSLPPSLLREGTEVNLTVRLDEIRKEARFEIPGRGEMPEDYLYPIESVDGFLHTNLFVNGVWYTVVPYGPIEIEAEPILSRKVKGTIMGKPFELLLPESLRNGSLLLRIFRGKDRLGAPGEEEASSEIVELASPVTLVKGFEIDRADDFRPPLPDDFGISTPPAVAVF